MDTIVAGVHRLLNRVGGAARTQTQIRRFMNETMSADELARSDRVSMIAGEMMRTQHGRQPRSDVAKRRQNLSDLCTRIFGSVFIAKMADASTENNRYIQLYVGLYPNPSAGVDVADIMQHASHDELLTDEDDKYSLNHYFGLVLHAYLDTKSPPRDFFMVAMFFLTSDLPTQESGSSVFEKIDLLGWAFPFEAGMILDDQHAFVIRNTDGRGMTSTRSDILGLIKHPSEQKYYQRRWKQSRPLSSESFWSAFRTSGPQIAMTPISKSRQQRQSLRSLLNTISLHDILELYSLLLQKEHLPVVPDGTKTQNYIRTSRQILLRILSTNPPASISLRTFLSSVSEALRNHDTPYSTKEELSDITNVIRMLLLADIQNLHHDIYHRIPDNLKEAILLFRRYIKDTDTVGKVYVSGGGA